MRDDVVIPLSSNAFSVDLQTDDALAFLEAGYPKVYQTLSEQFPEIVDIQWEGSWFDTEAMGVDQEWGSWLVDAIEESGVVFWEEGEPYGRL